MSQVQRLVNHCDICTHEWIPNPGVLYTHCTSSRCRSRKWNSVACALVTPKATSVTLSEPEVIRPNMETLRDICAGISTQHALEMIGAVPGPPQEREQCDYKEWNEQTGETYACGLSAHPAKVKHTRGRKM